MRSPLTGSARRAWRPWGWFVCASVLLLATHGDAAPGPPSTDPAVAAGTIVDELQSAARTVRIQLQSARAQRDVIKTACLNDKLTQLDVAVRNARERRDALLVAVAQSDAAVVAQEQARLEVTRQQGRRVAAEAQQCVGQPDPNQQVPSEVTPFVPPGLPSAGDYPPGDLFAVIQPPSAVSAYK
jgi:hypothetical protein